MGAWGWVVSVKGWELGGVWVYLEDGPKEMCRCHEWRLNSSPTSPPSHLNGISLNLAPIFISFFQGLENWCSLSIYWAIEQFSHLSFKIHIFWIAITNCCQGVVSYLWLVIMVMMHMSDTFILWISQKRRLRIKVPCRLGLVKKLLFSTLVHFGPSFSLFVSSIIEELIKNKFINCKFSVKLILLKLTLTSLSNQPVFTKVRGEKLKCPVKSQPSHLFPDVIWRLRRPGSSGKLT